MDLVAVEDSRSATHWVAGEVHQPELGLGVGSTEMRPMALSWRASWIKESGQELEEFMFTLPVSTASSKAALTHVPTGYRT